LDITKTKSFIFKSNLYKTLVKQGIEDILPFTQDSLLDPSNSWMTLCGTTMTGSGH